MGGDLERRGVWGGGGGWRKGGKEGERRWGERRRGRLVVTG